MTEPSNSFLERLFMLDDATWSVVEFCFIVINKLTSLALQILALVVGYVYVDCNREMSIWLLVSGFMTLGLSFSLFLSMTGRRRMSESFLIDIGIISIVWNIVYASALFFPVAAGPYPVHSYSQSCCNLTGSIMRVSQITLLLRTSAP